MGGAMFAFDCAEPLVLDAYKECAARFADLLVLQAALRLEGLRVGLCTLSKSAHSNRVKLVVRPRGLVLTAGAELPVPAAASYVPTT